LTSAHAGSGTPGSNELDASYHLLWRIDRVEQEERLDQMTDVAIKVWVMAAIRDPAMRQNLRGQFEVIVVLRHDYHSAIIRVRDVFEVRSTEQAGFRAGFRRDAMAPQCVGHTVGHVLVEMKGNGN
jgi:hypothetical protein